MVSTMQSRWSSVSAMGLPSASGYSTWGRVFNNMRSLLRRPSGKVYTLTVFQVHSACAITSSCSRLRVCSFSRYSRPFLTLTFMKPLDLFFQLWQLLGNECTLGANVPHQGV